MQTYEIEQSQASVIAFILGALNEPVTPYLHSIPENFKVPSVYFQPPELEYQPQTLTDFKRIHIMYVIFFGKTLKQAHDLAAAADMRIHVAHDEIPILDAENPEIPTGFFVHAKDMNVTTLEQDQATVQLSITWHTTHKYHRPDVQKTMQFHPNLFLKDSR